MGTVKKKLPTPDTNPVDGDKLIEETKPKKKVTKTEEKKPTTIEMFGQVGLDMQYVFEELRYITQWISELETKLNKVSRRLGL